MIVTILFRRGTTTQWASVNPVLESGEPGVDTVTGQFKIGDGVNNWTSLGTVGASDAAITELVEDPTSDLSAALSGTFVRHVRPSTGIALGDSNTASGVVTATGLYGENHFVYACALLGQRLQMLDIKGVPGDRVDEMEARLDTDVIAQRPGWCYFLGGTNDILQDTLIAAQASLERIMSKLRQNGIEPIICTVPPNTTQPARARLWNAYLKRYAAEQNILLVDYYAALVDPITGTWKVGYDTGDGTHLSNIGALACGQKALSTLDNYLPPALIPLVQDDSSTLNMLTKGMFTGTINGTTGVPQGWSSGQTNTGGYGTTSIVAGTGSNPGKWFQIDKTGATSYNVNQIKSTGFSIGDRMMFGGKMELETPAGGIYTSVSMVFRTTGGVLVSQKVPLQQFKQDVRDLSFYIEADVPATTIDIRSEFNTSAGGTGKVRYGQMTLTNLTTGVIL